MEKGNVPIAGAATPSALSAMRVAVKTDAVGPAGASVQDGAEWASSYCPRCSARLAPRSCKLICPGCGYYMSCSDFI
jgi:hypothetical protein